MTICGQTSIWQLLYRPLFSVLSRLNGSILCEGPVPASILSQTRDATVGKRPENESRFSGRLQNPLKQDTLRQTALIPGRVGQANHVDVGAALAHGIRVLT